MIFKDSLLKIFPSKSYDINLLPPHTIVYLHSMYKLLIYSYYIESMRTTYNGNIKSIFHYLMDNSYTTSSFVNIINSIGENVFDVFIKSGKYMLNGDINYSLLNDYVQFLLSLCVHRYEPVRKLANTYLLSLLKNFKILKYKRSSISALLEICDALTVKFDEILFSPKISTQKIYVPSLTEPLDLPSNRQVLKNIIDQMNNILDEWIYKGFVDAPQKMTIILHSFIHSMPKSMLPINHNTGVGLGTSVL